MTFILEQRKRQNAKAQPKIHSCSTTGYLLSPCCFRLCANDYWVRYQLWKVLEGSLLEIYLASMDERNRRS